MDPAKPAEAFVWQMMAARSYLALGQAKPAAALYQQLQKQAKSPVQQAQLQLLQAHLLLAQGNANQALILLEGKPDVVLDADTQKDWYRQRVVLQLDINNKFGAAKSLILLEPYLAKNELATNHQQIWSLLKSMTPSTLQALEEEPAPDVASLTTLPRATCRPALGISLSRTTVRCSRSPSSCRSPATWKPRAPPSATAC